MRLIRLWPVLAGMLVVGLGADARAEEGVVTLRWTAPGDDSLTGTASRYDIRYSLFPINELNFVYCSGPTGVPRPASPGTPQSFTVFGLLPGLRYYFALKTADERLNWSRVSNVVAFAQPAVGVGEAQPELSFAAPTPNPARNSAAFAFAIPNPSPVRVDIFDVQGRTVRCLADHPFPQSSGSLIWDLRDRNGVRVSPGLYLARARIGESVFTHRVMVTQ